MENNRNFFITIALSVLILTLWQVFYMNPRVEQQRDGDEEIAVVFHRSPWPIVFRAVGGKVRLST
ncbi:hypothetical protein EN742_33050, partial [Mesorhizobium sp. M4A.F.Ca.ET.020.02.1.1]|uniref:hypothetical protein n=1 Tax=Mesorhizobium sp. M4A.F.Ca.ET.020.02.1.1 TaxID=2496652 RepID=UPI000FD5F114